MVGQLGQTGSNLVKLGQTCLKLVLFGAGHYSRVGDQFVARKLDRSLQNESALEMFPNAVTEVLNLGLSDHCPLIVILNNSMVTRPKRKCPFKFFNFWADHPAFLDLVKNA